MSKADRVQKKREMRDKRRVNPQEVFDEFLSIMDDRVTGDVYTFQAKHVLNRHHLDEKRYPYSNAGDLRTISAYINNLCDGEYNDKCFIEVLKKSKGVGKPNIYMVTVYRW